MKRNGVLYICLISFITVNLWIFSKESLNEIIVSPLRSLTQLFALIGVTLFSIQFILATRANFINELFGSLDKMYVVHKFSGIIGGSALLLHLLTLLLNALPMGTLARSYLIPGQNFGYNMGIVALYLLTLMIFTSIYLKLPYHIWKLVHKVTGATVIFATLHVINIQSDVATSSYLRIWILFLLISAVIAWIYKLLLYKYLAPTKKYFITAISQHNNVVEIEMKPVADKINFKAGQFAFFSFRSKMLTNESHPFTIVSLPHEESVKILVKQLGDFTSKLVNLQVGDKVDIQGPYGIFGKNFEVETHDYIWIAGGIGITPFISLLDAALRKESDGNQSNVLLYYLTESEQEALLNSHILGKIKDSNRIKLYNNYSKVNGRLTVEKVESEVGSLNDKKFFFCGPQSMIHTFKEQLLRKGVPLKNIIYEDFDFKAV